MKVVKLEIRKHDIFEDYKNEIVGIVQLLGETGKMEVRLHPGTIAQIFRLCKADVQRVADYNAAQASSACDYISSELENQELKQIE